jgi:Type I restriction enzyme R protein N terminus (HSDR_N)
MATYNSLFADFDWDVLDQSGYKEDAVREDIIAPVLRMLGYAASGTNRMERSKSLVHPFVKIGSKKHTIHLVPDYTLYCNDRPLMIIEAKSPSEGVVRTEHVEQAYSYAIHQEIRCQQFSLCNGKEWAFYDIHNMHPLFVLQCKELLSQWNEVEKYLLPKYLKMPELRGFRADLGNQLRMMGVKNGQSLLFPGCMLQLITKCRSGLHPLYTAMATYKLGGLECIASFDFPISALMDIVDRLPAAQASQILSALDMQPYQIDADCKVVVTWDGQMGNQIEGPFEVFSPFYITRIHNVVYSPSNTVGEVDPKAVEAQVKQLCV